MSTALRNSFLIVHNPSAGLKGRTLSRRVAHALQRRGARVVMIPSWGYAPREEAAALADRVMFAGFDAVVAAGGDGTVRALAGSLAHTNVSLGIIPMGTGNVLAQEIGLPHRPAAIADVLMNGPVAKISGAWANDRPFFLMAGAGFDGEIISRLDTPLKRRLGKAAYVGPVLAGLRTLPTPLSVMIDGRPYPSATWIIATRARHYAGRFLLAPDADLHETALHVVLLRATTRTARLKELFDLARGRLAAGSSVELVKCTHLEIEAERPVPAQIDGDAAGTLPLRVSTDNAPAMHLIVPRQFLADQQ